MVQSAAALGSAALGCRGEAKRASVSVEPAATPVITEVDEAAADSMDEALALLTSYGHGGGNHAPMGAEALIAMGFGARVVPWVEWYIARERMRPRPTAAALAPSEYSKALGAQARIGEWNATFREAIAAQPWAEVVREWLPRLMPGLAAAATHGLIRTAHALRSLSRADTPLRRGELADALAYWAAFFQPVVSFDRAAPDSPPQLPSQVIRSVPLAKKRHRRMMPSLEARSREPDFARAVRLAHPSAGDESAFLSDLTATFADIYTAFGDSEAIPLIHAVTGPAAVRLLFPHLDDASRSDAARYAWHAAAGLWASFAPGPVPEKVDAASTKDTWPALLERHADIRDVHAIKLAEACWREARASKNNAPYLAATSVAVARF